MALTFKFYHDAALTQEITSLSELTATQDGGVLLGPVNKTIYLGSTATGTKLQVTTAPGVDPVVVSIVDAAGGSGAPATEFRLSLSPITGAETPGASLSLSNTILSGVGNRVTIYTRRTSALTVPAVHTDVSLQVANPYESPV